jgi:hypothetical protein
MKIQFGENFGNGFQHVMIRTGQVVERLAFSFHKNDAMAMMMEETMTPRHARDSLQVCINDSGQC